MQVKAFMTLIEAHNAALERRKTAPTVVQGREHAPTKASFNGRGDNYVQALADLYASRGLITPHQRYDIALQRDRG